jgi:hypothetical protein
MLLQDLLFTSDLLEENMLEEVQNIGSQLKVLNQASGRQTRKDRKKNLFC